jgi:hypothetical protein
MLATDTSAEAWTGLATIIYSHLDELTYTLLIEYLEWVNLQNLLLHVCWEE